MIAFDLATPIETFGRVRLPDGRPGYRLVVAGHEPSVQAGPVRLAVDDGLDAIERADLVVVPGRNDPLQPSPPAVLAALRAGAHRGTRIASICVGAFTLAEAGLLDGRDATTHWLAADELARRHPAVRLNPDVLYTDNGSILTSAGASSGLDLCLHIVQRDYGVAVAADAARLAVAPLHRPGGQAQYIVRNRATHRTSTLQRALSWIEANAYRDLTLADIAAAAGMSVRTLIADSRTRPGRAPCSGCRGCASATRRTCWRPPTTPSTGSLPRLAFQRPATSGSSSDNSSASRPARTGGSSVRNRHRVCCCQGSPEPPAVRCCS